MSFYESADFISVYTRENALEDGVLHDVSNTAKEAGFKFSVAVTSEVMELIKNIPKKYSFQSVDGRLYDLLCIASIAARGSNSSEIRYKLELPHLNMKNRIVKTAHFKATIGSGDNHEPVITIMLPYQD